MTIAACYVSSEGVILGADSTSTVGDIRQYDYEQKILEIGDSGSTLGLMTWGCGGLPEMSYRQLAAMLSDDLVVHPPATVQECAERWNGMLWGEYSTRLMPRRQRYQALHAQPTQTPAEIEEMNRIVNATEVGFCLGGHVRADRTPRAFSVNFHPNMVTPGPVVEVARSVPTFWAGDFFVNRLLKGIDEQAYRAILGSPHWHGNSGDLDSILRNHALRPWFQMPLREAIDWIYSLIFITIKAVKFAPMPPVIGGPIEIAAITADRPFRWVCHKRLDHAISDHSVPEMR